MQLPPVSDTLLYCYSGTKFGIPLDGSLSGVTLFVFIMDNHPGLTIDIGRSAINLPDGLDLSSLDSTPTDCSAIMTKFKGKEKVGRVSYRISKISLFTDGNNKDSFNDSNTVPEAEGINVLCPLPDFRFNRLAKPIHWERLKGLNLDRYEMRCEKHSDVHGGGSPELLISKSNPKLDQ